MFVAAHNFDSNELFERIHKEMLEKIEFNYKWVLLADRLAYADACAEYAACEQACAQHLNIIDRLKEINALTCPLMLIQPL